MDDYLDPNFDDCRKCHDWKNYITDEIRAVWCNLHDELKRMIYEMAEDLASGEEWD